MSSELLMCGSDYDAIFRRTLLGYYAEGRYAQYFVI